MNDDNLKELKDYTFTLVEELIEDGSNLDVDHTVEHHFSSESFDVLETAAVTAFKQGFDVEEPEEAELETGEKVFAFDIITEHPLDPELIFDEAKKMVALAQQAGVDYDGWGTYFEE